MNINDIDEEVLRFLMTGYSAHQPEHHSNPPELKLSDKVWYSFRQMIKMKGFEGIIEHMMDFKHEWNDFINGSRDLPAQF